MINVKGQAPMNSRRPAIVIIAAVLISIIGLSSFLYLNSLQNSGGTLESIEVAYSPFESTALFLIAQEKGFLSQNALNVTLQRYDTGAAALAGVINGEADLVVGVTEFPLVVQALNQESIQTIGSISKSNFIYIVGRADRGINEVSDLKGKTIGTTYGTIAHYYLGRFLTLNGINTQDLVLVDLKTPTEWVEAVVNGSVDAVATAQPSANLAKEGLGDNAIVWSIQNNQPLYAQAVATKSWITEHPELCSRFLNALYQAESFLIDNPNEAKTITKQQLNFSDDSIETVWEQNHFSLSLDQSLILAMEGEARWLIDNNLTKQTQTPDFINYVHTDCLASIKHGAVSIIR
jgi:NitT/TauT family transport system substrate-binding protein